MVRAWPITRRAKEVAKRPHALRMRIRHNNTSLVIEDLAETTKPVLIVSPDEEAEESESSEKFHSPSGVLAAQRVGQQGAELGRAAGIKSMWLRTPVYFGQVGPTWPLVKDRIPRFLAVTEGLTGGGMRLEMNPHDLVYNSGLRKKMGVENFWSEVIDRLEEMGVILTETPLNVEPLYKFFDAEKPTEEEHDLLDRTEEPPHLSIGGAAEPVLPKRSGSESPLLSKPNSSTGGG